MHPNRFPRDMTVAFINKFNAGSTQIELAQENKVSLEQMHNSEYSDIPTSKLRLRLKSKQLTFNDCKTSYRVYLQNNKHSLLKIASPKTEESELEDNQRIDMITPLQITDDGLQHQVKSLQDQRMQNVNKQRTAKDNHDHRTSSREKNREKSSKKVKKVLVNKARPESKQENLTTSPKRFPKIKESESSRSKTSNSTPSKPKTNVKILSSKGNIVRCSSDDDDGSDKYHDKLLGGLHDLLGDLDKFDLQNEGELETPFVPLKTYFEDKTLKNTVEVANDKELMNYEIDLQEQETFMLERQLVIGDPVRKRAQFDHYGEVNKVHQEKFFKGLHQTDPYDEAGEKRIIQDKEGLERLIKKKAEAINLLTKQIDILEDAIAQLYRNPTHGNFRTEFINNLSDDQRQNVLQQKKVWAGKKKEVEKLKQKMLYIQHEKHVFESILTPHYQRPMTSLSRSDNRCGHQVVSADVAKNVTALSPNFLAFYYISCESYDDYFTRTPKELQGVLKKYVDNFSKTPELVDNFLRGMQRDAIKADYEKSKIRQLCTRSEFCGGNEDENLDENSNKTEDESSPTKKPKLSIDEKNIEASSSSVSNEVVPSPSSLKHPTIHPMNPIHPMPDDSSDEEELCPTNHITDINIKFILSKEQYQNRANGNWRVIIDKQAILNERMTFETTINKYKQQLTCLTELGTELSKVNPTCHGTD